MVTASNIPSREPYPPLSYRGAVEVEISLLQPPSIDSEALCPRNIRLQTGGKPRGAASERVALPAAATACDGRC